MAKTSRGTSKVKRVTVNTRVTETLRDLSRVIAAKKGITVAAFYALAIEQAVNRHRPRHKVTEPEFVETEDIREAIAQDLVCMKLMDPPFEGTWRDV